MRNATLFGPVCMVEHVRGLVQTIFGKIDVIVTLGGEGVTDHDITKLQWTQYYHSKTCHW